MKGIADHMLPTSQQQVPVGIPAAGRRVVRAMRRISGHLLACIRDPAATERFLAQTEAALRGMPATPPGDGRGR